MRNLIDELLEFTKKDSKTEFDIWHYNCTPVLLNKEVGIAIENSIEKFLTSRLDEVRLRHAHTCARNILKLTDIDDADYFRQGLLRREMTGTISYSKQRDHSAHTLYNYLLGWYVFSNCSLLKQEIEKHFALRSYKNETVRNFAMLWPMISIVHDIGYLFEGSTAPLVPSVQNKQVALGAEVVQDYFHHQFWIECKIDSTDDRTILRRLTKVEEPNFALRSMSSIADSLRLLGSLTSLQQEVLTAVKEKNYPKCSWDKLKLRLPEDSFDLWETNYSFFQLKSMENRISALRKFFDYQMTSGLEGTGLRMLDHGICSGLLLLLYSTYYFRMYAGLERQKPLSKDHNDLYLRFTDRTHDEGIAYHPDWWWNVIIWATSATAIHNFLQLNHPDPKTLPYEIPNPLKLEEDPLAYLGILVDCCQEWDRYTVSQESAIGGPLPLQGIEVELGVKNSKVVLKFIDNNFRDKVKKNLNHSLADWDKIISVN